MGRTKVIGKVKFNAPVPGGISNPLRGGRNKKALKTHHARNLSKAGVKEPRSPLI